MKVRPLQDHVLVELMPTETKSAGGIELPETAQETATQGIVRRIGCWPQAKKTGALIPYDFKVGDRVLVQKHAGTKFDKAVNRNLRLVRSFDIIAVLSENIC